MVKHAGTLARLQALAHAAGFLRAEAETLHEQGNITQALQSQLQHDSSGAVALSYLARALEEPELSPTQSVQLRDAVLGCLPQLAEVQHPLRRSQPTCFEQEHLGA